MPKTPEELNQIYCALSERELQALDNCGEEHGIGPRHLVSGLGWTGYAAKKILKQLREKELVDFGYLMDEDGMLQGRGYWLTDTGKQIQNVFYESFDRPVPA